MHYTPSVTRDSLLDLAAFLVRDRDRYERHMEQARVFPRMLAKIEGERDATSMALAYCAGMLGCGTVEEVVALARRERPTVTGGAWPPEPAGCGICDDPTHGAMAHATPASSPASSWPIDHEAGE